VVGLPGLGPRGRGGLFALALAYPGGMGMGDVKMGGMLGAFLGAFAALTVFLGAFLGPLACGVLLVTGKDRRRAALPFGMLLSVAGVLTLFLGQELWGSYLRLMGRA
jgi:leader peptidase (prepilin peptidase)/N-methyltransferase